MRLRRGWRYLLLLLALVAGLIGFGLWRLSRDDERLTQWLVDSVQSATGLHMRTQGSGRFGFWPRLSIAIEGVQLTAAAGIRAPVRIGAMRVQVPWSSVFGRALRVSAVEIEDVVLDAQAIEAWRASRRDLGPMPAVRWPSLEAVLKVHSLRYQTPGADGGVQDTFVLHTLQLDRWQTNQASRLSASFGVAALGPELFRLELLCTPRQARNNIAIEPCSATVERNGSASLALRGYLRHEDSARIESQLRVESPQPPAWVDTRPARFADLPIDLAVRLHGAFDGPLKLKLGGPFADSTVEADIVLPYGWIDLVEARAWNTLAENTTGYARIDKLRASDAELNDIEWRNEKTAETAQVRSTPTGAMNLRQQQ